MAEAKSHVIPRSVMMAHADQQDIPRLIGSGGGHPKRLRTGVYDETILCHECEKVFGPWDDYGKRFLLDMPASSHFLGTDAEYSQVDGIDYDRLKLFFVSVLWRASVSTHPFYSRVRLGPHEARIRAMLLTRSPGSADDYSVLLERFIYPPEAIPTLGPEPCGRIEGRRFYRLLMNGVVAKIKVDQARCPTSLQDFVLSPGRPAYFLHKEYKGSVEHRRMARAASACRWPGKNR